MCTFIVKNGLNQTTTIGVNHIYMIGVNLTAVEVASVGLLLLRVYHHCERLRKEKDVRKEQKIILTKKGKVC